MRIRYAILLLSTSLATSCDPHENQKDKEVLLACTIRCEGTVEEDKSPRIFVELTNRTKREIVLVRGLYGSNGKMRYPHCYFKVTGPKPAVEPNLVEWCGVLDNLLEEDFVKVAPGATFNPYGNDQAARGQELLPGQFVPGGQYRLKFVYSTAATDINDWLGTPQKNEPKVPALEKLLAGVPRTTVESNEITIKAIPAK